MNLESALAAWEGEEVLIRRDRAADAWIVIAIHSTRLGPATGGTRMRPYPDLAAALADALKLAEGMTYKFAVTGHPRGGGKAVIAVPARLDSAARTQLLLAYGRLIAQLGGLYQTGPDVGTSPEDMDVIARTGSPHVFCRTPAAGGAGDSSLPTASGVHSGIETVCERLFGSRELVGRRILVQGAGSVGLRLIELLVASGASVIVADPDSERAELAGGVGEVRVVSPEQLLDEPGDVFSPCALGGVLDMDTVDRLKCRAVAGAANNQLAGEGAAERLRRRGILYAPDYVVNIGGAMAIPGIELEGWSQADAAERVRVRVREALWEVFDLAESDGVTTEGAARRIAQARLDR